MFLNSLSKKQKNLFMDLAIKAAEANGVVELAEKNMLKAYGIEMEITPFYSSDCEIEMVLQEMKDISTESELKIVLFEILGILISRPAKSYRSAKEAVSTSSASGMLI